MASAEPLRLVADRLACRRGERLLFENLSFSIPGGAGLTLGGPNGAGKTSLMRILAGLLTPTAGEARVEPKLDIPDTERCLFLGVRDGLKAALTPREHLAFWAAMDGGDGALPPPADAAHAALAAWDLLDFADAPVGWLSTGQRRRLALARLAGSARRVWLLDEPLNGLDAAAAAALAQTAARFMEGGGIIVAASHQPLGWDRMAALVLPQATDGAP